MQLKFLVIDEDIVNNQKIENYVKDKSQFQMTTVGSVEAAISLMNPVVNKPSTAPSAGGTPEAPTVPEEKISTEIQPEALKPQLIFVDVTKIGSTPLKWHADFREALKLGGNEKVPIVLLSLSSDPHFIRGFLAEGVFDVLIKPVISSNLEFILNYFLNEEKGPARKIIPMKSIAEMFYPAVAKEISEFEMKIITNKEVLQNDFKPIYGDFFKWTPNRRIIARCTDSQKDEEIKGAFLQTFTFVGLPSAITKEIRVWLRNYYVSKKQKDQ